MLAGLSVSPVLSTTIYLETNVYVIDLTPSTSSPSSCSIYRIPVITDTNLTVVVVPFYLLLPFFVFWESLFYVLLLQIIDTTKGIRFSRCSLLLYLQLRLNKGIFTPFCISVPCKFRSLCRSTWWLFTHCWLQRTTTILIGICYVWFSDFNRSILSWRGSRLFSFCCGFWLLVFCVLVFCILYIIIKGMLVTVVVNVESLRFCNYFWD